MALGWGQAAGFLGKLADRITDPVRKADALKEKRAKLLKQKHSAELARRLADLDAQLQRVSKEIARRASGN